MERYANLIASDLAFCIKNPTQKDETELSRMAGTYTMIWNRSNRGFIVGVIVRKKQSAIDIGAVKRHIPTAHIEPLRRSITDAVKYINSI